MTAPPTRGLEATVRALSIRQPWAHLILMGRKDVENRSWPTHHRGALLLHASKKFWPEDMKDNDLDPDWFVRGALVGVMEVVDCTQKVSSEWHQEGEYGWYLRRPLQFVEPIPYKGAVGLFNVPDDLVAQALKSAQPHQPPEE